MSANGVDAPRPGPYRAVEKDLRGNLTHVIEWSEDGEQVTEGVYGEANARLLAAAPDLRDALSYTRGVLEAVRDGASIDSLEDVQATSERCIDKIEFALKEAGVEV